MESDPGQSFEIDPEIKRFDTVRRDHVGMAT